MAITVKELAKKLSISPSAVSMALNGKPGVSEATRQRVVEAAKEGGYDFSRIKGANEKNGSIVFLADHSRDVVAADTPVFLSRIGGIVAACKDFRYALEMRYIYDNQIEEELVSLLTSGVRGLLLAANISEIDRDLLQNFPIPMVIMDFFLEDVDKDYVLINNEQGAFLATSLLIDRYRQTPGFLQSSYLIENFVERERGYRRAISRLGAQPEVPRIHALTPSIVGAYADMREVLRQTPPVRAYYAANDQIAIGAMRALREAGYRIPEDVAMIGFDDSSICEMAEPPLTTIHVPHEYIGRVSVERLVYLIEHGEEQVPTITQRANTHLVERDSF